MGVIIFLIIIAILLIIFLIFFIQYKINKKYVLDQFDKCNTITYGPIGYGKDVLFQTIIKDRDKEYYSNLNYGYKCVDDNITPLKLSVLPNTYDNMLSNDIHFIDKTFKENCDFYISDGSIYLPSHMDSQLHKKYPSLPLFYSLVRQLYDSHIHVNVQSIDRLWKPLREQADFFLKANGVINLPFILIVKFRSYDKLESAKQNLLPLKKVLFNKQSKADYQKYIATNGEIRKGYLIIKKSDIKYDTREFHKKLFNEIAPPKTKKTMRKK